MANQVRVAVSAPGAKGASSEVDNLRDKFTKLQQTSAKGLAIGAGAAITTAGLNLVKNAIGDVTGEIGDSIQAYREDETAQVSLGQALKANVPNWDGNTSAIDANTQKMEKLGFTNTETAQSLTLLVGATHDVNAALQAQAVAADLARYKNLSLADAGQLVVNVMAGNYRGLRQLGIATKDIHDSTSALAAIEQVAGGQAQAYAQTDLGQMDAAYAKVDESQQKFGKDLSHIEAEVLPAAADALSSVADSLGTVQTMLDSNTSSVDKAAAANDFWSNGLVQAFVPGAGAAANAASQLKTVVDAQASSYASSSEELAGLSQNVGNSSRDFGRFASNLDSAVAPALGRTADTIEYLSTEALVASSTVQDLATEIETQLYGKAITAGQRAQLVQNIDDLRKSLEKTHKGRDATILAGQLADARKSLFDFDLQAAEAQGPAALQKFLKDTLKNAEKTNPQLAALAANLLKVDAAAARTGAGIRVSVFNAGTGVGKAAKGAHAKKGQPFIVGEEGEELWVPDEPGTIVPHDATKAMMSSGPAIASGVAGASVTVVVNLPNAYGMTPGQGDALGRAIAPHVLRAMQRRGFLPNARAF